MGRKIVATPATLSKELHRRKTVGEGDDVPVIVYADTARLRCMMK
jgi:hypothetical protein